MLVPKVARFAPPLTVEAQVAVMRVELRDRGVDATEMTDAALAAVLERTGDRGLAVDALAMYDRPRWLRDLLCRAGP